MDAARIVIPVLRLAWFDSKILHQMEFIDKSGTAHKHQGNIGVARAVYEYTKLGYTVLAPLSDSDKYDLVIDTGTLLRVQVKTSTCKKKDYSGKGYNRTGYQVNLATKGGNTKKNTVRNRTEGDYDVLFVLLETGECWSIPATELTGTTQISLGANVESKYDQYKIG